MIPNYQSYKQGEITPEDANRLEESMAEIATLKEHIANYSKARKVFDEYRVSGWSKTNAFHGKTLGILSTLGDQSKYKYPVLKDLFLKIPFGDIDALEKALKSHSVSAFIVEPIQGEGGIITPPEEYLKMVRALCDKYGVTLIFDEIQTGLGRCGFMFCFQQYGIVPDILCLAKSLSGGIIPIGCVSIKEDSWKYTYGKMGTALLPTTTFGGNTFASVVAIKTLSVLREEDLCERANKMGAYALQQLHALKQKHAIITDVRGTGLFIGLSLED